ncbi:unnamed protein product [Sphenostylis stenocarpa]|uniref:Cytochrome P450 n=1 Tax=Sphenostylis stenocarpa TaxID=92480 RepID=A0AA86W1R1_9FABA|nr:unnamed protein product [Sphenostylis stenocarpa]
MGLPKRGAHKASPHQAGLPFSHTLSARKLVAFGLGSTPVVVTSHAHVAREILNSPHFSDRPVKQSAKSLMFNRAIGFAPNGAYCRLLRRVASTTYSPAAHSSPRAWSLARLRLHVACYSSRAFQNRVRVPKKTPPRCSAD